MAKNTVNNIIKAIPDYIFKYLYIPLPEKLQSPDTNNMEFIYQISIKMGINIIIITRLIFKNIKYIFLWN